MTVSLIDQSINWLIYEWIDWLIVWFIDWFSGARPGTCPLPNPIPGCKSITGCSFDDLCPLGEKCCLQSNCTKKCVKTDKALLVPGSLGRKCKEKQIYCESWVRDIVVNFTLTCVYFLKLISLVISLQESTVPILVQSVNRYVTALENARGTLRLV